MKIKVLLLMFAIVIVIKVHAAPIHIAIKDWSITYPPTNEVAILIHDTENVGLNIVLVFWRGTLPADQIVYDKGNKSLKVYYAITDFRNVQELLNTVDYLFYVYSPDEGFGETAYLSKF